MMKKVLYASFVGSAVAGSIEISSSDLSSAGKACDNIKGSWSQGVKLFGRSATLSAEYDRSDKKDALSEATLAGVLDKIKYEYTTKFGGAADLTLETTTDDGTTLEVESEVEDLHVKVTKLTASRATSMRGQDYDLELSHALDSSESKLSLSTVLGSGVKAIGTLTSAGGKSDLGYEIEYDTTLTKGRTLSANCKPQEGSGEIEYVDSVTLGDSTITANIPLGGKATVSVSRSFDF